jgi:hypothetical protein
MVDRPFCHRIKLQSVGLLLNTLLGIDAGDKNPDYFALVHQQIEHVQRLYEDGQLTAEKLADGSEVHVRERELYLTTDGARVTHVPWAWGKTVSVLRIRLSGYKQGIVQLRCLLQVSERFRTFRNVLERSET